MIDNRLAVSSPLSGLNIAGSVGWQTWKSAAGIFPPLELRLKSERSGCGISGGGGGELNNSVHVVTGTGFCSQEQSAILSVTGTTLRSVKPSVGNILLFYFSFLF